MVILDPFTDFKRMKTTFQLSYIRLPKGSCSTMGDGQMLWVMLSGLIL